ncbi:MAG: alpha/beta hydrolase [Bdellovibrionales bacterium]
MHIFSRAVFFTLCLFSIQTMARGLSTQKMIIEADNVNLQGYRFLNANGEPGTGKWVIFSHGLASNLHEFEYLIPVFLDAGYDCYAFNYRGHGNGEERSTVKVYHEGDYELEHMAREDVPAMVNAVQKIHPGKGIILGHSMGGMAPRGSFAHGLITSDQIEAMILLGSPPHFKSTKADLYSSDIFGILKVFEGWLNVGPGNADIHIERTKINIENTMDWLNLFSVTYWWSKGVIKSLVRTEIHRAFGSVGDLTLSDNWLSRAMSASIPKDIMRSVARYTRTHYPYEDVKIPVPILHIMGGSDVLVKHQDIATHAMGQSEDAGYWLARVNGVGHLGLVSPKAIDSYHDVLFDFLRTEGDLGSSHKSYYEITPGYCAKLLAPHKVRVAI